MLNDIAHRLRLSEASWGVTIQYVTVNCDDFLTTEYPLIRAGQDGMAGRCRMMTGEAALLGFSPSDIFVDRTRVSSKKQTKKSKINLKNGNPVFYPY